MSQDDSIHRMACTGRSPPDWRTTWVYECFPKGNSISWTFGFAELEGQLQRTQKSGQLTSWCGSMENNGLQIRIDVGYNDDGLSSAVVYKTGLPESWEGQDKNLRKIRLTRIRQERRCPKTNTWMTKYSFDWAYVGAFCTAT